MKHILITSISAKAPLIEMAKSARDEFDKTAQIFGCDISEDIVGRYFVDQFFTTKPIKKLNIFEFISICEEKKIRYILPTRDEDVLYFSTHKELLNSKNIAVFTPDQTAVKMCIDKYDFVSKNGVDFNIKTALNIDDLVATDRFVVKERFGAGSKSVSIDLTADQAKESAKNMQNPIFQEYISGDEYSIDSFVSKENRFVGMIIRKRELVSSGESVITSVVDDKKLEDLTKEFLLKNRITMHSVTQVIRQDDSFFLVECNTRFGGASTLSYKMGLKSFLWFLLEENGIDFEYKRATKNLRQIRVKKDIYFES